MMITGRSGMRFSTEKIKKEEKPKFNWNLVFDCFAILNMGFLIGYVLCAMGRVF